MGSPRTLSWAEVVELATEDLLRIERRRAALVEAEAALDGDGDVAAVAVSNRLRELRGAARQRALTMPMFPDSPEEIAELADVVEGMRELQARTAVWQTD